MKKHTLLSDIAVFLLIFFILIVPPFFAAAISADNPLFQIKSFPWYPLLLAVFSSVLLYFYYEKIEKKLPLIFFQILYTYGLMFAFALFCQFLSITITGSNALGSEAVVKPQGVVRWIIYLLSFIFSAFYEEVIYRFYFPDALLSLITRKKDFRFSKSLCEILGLLVFAFGHQYLGWIAVLNAGFAHIFLRLCYKKTGKVWPGVIAHFIYNVVSLILL